MNREDYVVSAIGMNDKVRIFVANTTNMVREASKVHGLFPVPTAALGRTLTAGSLMSCTLKNERDALTIQIIGNGPLGSIVVCADSKSNVRGYVDNPYVDLPIRDDGKLDVSGAVGFGVLNVIKDIGLKEPYSGNVELISGEIAEDLAYYFNISEQTNSAVALGVYLDKDGSVINAGGFILQLLPGYDEETVSFLEDQIAKLPPMTRMLSEGLTCEEIISRIFKDKDYRILDTRTTRFKCNCSYDKMERNLISLGLKELKSLAEDEKTELVCHFCNSKYNFSQEDMKALVDRLESK